MNKSDFVYVIAEKAGLTKRDAERATDAVFEAIVEVMQAGGKVQFPGFGAFSARRRAAFTGRHPKTGEPLHSGNHGAGVRTEQTTERKGESIIHEAG